MFILVLLVMLWLLTGAFLLGQLCLWWWWWVIFWKWWWWFFFGRLTGVGAGSGVLSQIIVSSWITISSQTGSWTFQNGFSLALKLYLIGTLPVRNRRTGRRMIPRWSWSIAQDSSWRMKIYIEKLQFTFGFRKKSAY